MKKKSLGCLLLNQAKGWRQWWGLKRWMFDNAPAVTAEYKKLVQQQQQGR